MSWVVNPIVVRADVTKFSNKNYETYFNGLQTDVAKMMPKAIEHALGETKILIFRKIQDFLFKHFFIYWFQRKHNFKWRKDARLCLCTSAAPALMNSCPYSRGYLSRNWFLI